MTDKREVKIKELDNSSLEIESSISVKELDQHREKALKILSEDISIDGFRKGHIPENVLVEKIGEMNILNQMAELALSDIYPIIVLENKIDVIGQPQITITKMAPNNPIEFKIISTILPKFNLPNYKKIAKKINSEKTEKIEVTEEDVSNTVNQIKKTNPETELTGKEQENNEEKETTSNELTKETLKKLGDFKDIEDFKDKLKENIRQEKTNKAIEAKRVKIMDAILSETEINLPEIIIQSETDRILAQTKSDIERMGLQFDKYLEHLKKTEEDLRKELQPDAEKRAKIQFILDKIIKAEKIEPNEEEANKNIEQILNQHKEAKKEDVENYIKMVLSNQEVFKLLEKQI
jgi:FKBP-type peptidyl-prolyl cis-trans isomerase (trigger factor)